MRFLSNSFEFSKVTNVFTAEISELSQGGMQEIFHQIYNDACDEGLTIVSTSTGHAVDYVIEKINVSTDNEITSWLLDPTRDSLHKVPACLGTRVIIYND